MTAEDDEEEAHKQRHANDRSHCDALLLGEVGMTEKMKCVAFCIRLHWWTIYIFI